jgi:hypothetical protein
MNLLLCIPPRLPPLARPQPHSNPPPPLVHIKEEGPHPNPPRREPRHGGALHHPRHTGPLADRPRRADRPRGHCARVCDDGDGGGRRFSWGGGGGRVADADGDSESKVPAAEVDSAVAAVRAAYVEMPCLDALIPALLRHGVSEVNRFCTLTPGFIGVLT